MSTTLNLDQYTGDDRERFARALADARECPGSTLIVPPGTYTLSSELARSTMRDVISGKYGENPENAMFSPDFPFTVWLSFKGHRGTTVMAYGATLMIDGFMEPVELKECRDVTLCGLSIDHVRKPYSKGVIEEYSVDDAGKREGSIVVRFAPEYPVDEHTIMPRMCAYDFGTGRFNLDMKLARKEWIGDGRMRLFMRNMPGRNLLGQEFYIWHTFHYRPAILIEEAINVTLRDVTIHSQPGMGIVGHRSEDILLERFAVVPSLGEHMSVNTDATHFTSCKGTLRFEGCRFAGHGDDATNVHTFYHDIEPLGGCAYRGSVGTATHSLTLDHPDAGDTLELVDKQSLTTLGVYRVQSVEPDGKALRYTATLDRPLPPDAGNCWLADVTRLPRLIFSRCTVDNHWARAVLIKTRHALVENCLFTGSSLQAIHVAAEGWWHEGVSCEDVVIRENRFTTCGVTGHAQTGGVLVEMAVDERRGTPQRHIVIEDNLFDLKQVEHAVSVSNADDVLIARNRFIGAEQPISVRDCTNVVEQDNQVYPSRGE